MEQSDGAESSVATRVLIANLPSELSQRLGQLVREQPDMQLINTLSGHNNAELLLAAADGVDILILRASPAYPLPAICTHLLGEFAHLRIMVVDPASTDAGMLYWLGLRQQPCVTAPPERLITSIRDAARLDAVD